MNKILLSFILIGSIFIKAQDITVIPQDTLLVDTLGAEMIFNFNIKNISAQEQTIFIMRTMNDLPSDWQSSLCFSLCFAPFVDSIVTSKDFGSSPLTSGETREVSVHVFSQNNHGIAHLQITAGTLNNPNILYKVNLTATVNPTSVTDLNPSLNDFVLSQNYPNPFNPSTKISWRLPISGWQSLKIYDMLSREVATLVNEYKPAGIYEVEFDGSMLSTGIYLYRFSSSNFVQTRKMVLEK